MSDFQSKRDSNTRPNSFTDKILTGHLSEVKQTD